ncbi:hypothetical protein [Providencia sp. Je.9.19]|uniref:hypothetical protein n=1 Tax=Providencia sp. Je.9.19 TaxID=3142844 RepID=UPI003DA97E88
MKGTTLTDLNWAYDDHASILANRRMACEGWKSIDSYFFEVHLQKQKLYPRGKTFMKLLTLCGEAEFYD